jgi:hypothetical protein
MASDHSDSLYTDVNFSDIYHLNTEGEYNQYLYHYRFHTGWVSTTPNRVFIAEYQNEAIKGRYAYYPDLYNRISFNKSHERLYLSYKLLLDKVNINPYFFLGDNMGFGLSAHCTSGYSNYSIESNTSQHAASFAYQIEKEAGTIPFRWINNSIKLSASKQFLGTSLSVADISALPCDGAFTNNLDGLIVATNIDLSLPNNLSASLQASYIDIDAKLNYNSSQYGSIDNFRSLVVNSQLRKKYYNLDSDLGFSAFFSGIGSESYIDIWPFTYLDVFLAHRTRFKQLGIEAYSPSLSFTYYGSRKQVQGLNYSIGLNYNHVFHKEEIVVRNRKAVLYPFLFTYTTDTYNWQDDLDAIVRIPLQASYRHGRLFAELNINQMLPFKWSKVFSSDSGSSSEAEAAPRQWQWGGLNCGVTIGYDL